jgi:hypothetical protein
LDLPDKPVTVVYSETRYSEIITDLDCDNCAQALDKMTRDSQSGCSSQWLLSARKIYRDETIFMRKRGIWDISEKHGLDVQFLWKQEASCQNGDTAIKCGIGNIKTGITKKLLQHLVLFPSAIIFSSLDAQKISPWFQSNKQGLWKVRPRYETISLNVPYVLNQFPETTHGSVIAHGGDDFGGFYLFCHGRGPWGEGKP